MAAYSDFVERMVLRPETLERLLIKDPDEPETIIRIREATDEDLLGGQTPAAPEYVPILRAALFYLFDSYPDSHTLAQESSTDLASYLHGMLHRREGDFDNARYWFRTAGQLPFFPELHRRVGEYSPDFAKQFNWDPYLFTYHCEQARFGEQEHTRELIAIQKDEFAVVLAAIWKKLFPAAAN
jgi:hypothetical protein